jgi:hypothetical protein
VRNFFDDLKQVLIEQNVSNGHGYFETIKQNAEKIREIITDYETNEMYIGYEADTTDGYSDGCLNVTFRDWSQGNYTYSIQLLYDERYWGYCQCTPEDEGYDPVMNCCGNGCDWTAPRISAVKTIRLAFASFDGSEKDLWKLEEDWKQEYEEVEEDKVAAQVKWFDEQIAEIQKRKEMFLQEQTKL